MAEEYRRTRNIYTAFDNFGVTDNSLNVSADHNTGDNTDMTLNLVVKSTNAPGDIAIKIWFRTENGDAACQKVDESWNGFNYTAVQTAAGLLQSYTGKCPGRIAYITAQAAAASPLNYYTITVKMDFWK